MDDNLRKVLADVAAEREAQHRTWGVQDLPDGTGPEFTERAEEAKRACTRASASGDLAWRHLLTEEFLEALAESDPVALRSELVQTAAVAVQWIQALDRRRGLTADNRHSQADNGDPSPEKLVRDRIPEIIARSGGHPHSRVADPEEYVSLLRAKLFEEATEYTDDGDPDELADILEVLHALAAVHGLAPDELEHRRAAKTADRGGFARKLVLRLPAPRDDRR